MRDYQRMNTKYRLPHHLYRRTMELIRDYNRIKEEANDILEESKGQQEVQSEKKKKGSQVEAKAVKRENYMVKINAVDRALKQIPEEYRKGVWANIVYGTAYPEDAGRNTYGRAKARFIYYTAKYLGDI